ncbi:RagB/SusD family nutrient uptake outer membrane protein [Odoribacter splanchnicus]|jgi:susD family|uniref:RagB/SusD family nutrient uptake outer membrane protein n=1 Tax=Odoribacter splanchnicus TaxID=28118 RepID=UPI0018992F39|nr:RagB/SusD family nutrient uptake outer membrane protein [Odoribacter splanchnicus]MDB9204050.1 RagB/SusD family nutrient uptake outer membrane protein [Odoribacter splanchnicus]
MRRVPGTLSNNNMERSGVREAYNLILEDLDYAIDYGPVYKDVFSASRGLAKGFKVEVLLLRGTDEDYAKVPELANEVLSNYEFKLEESFEDVFKNGYKSTEIMFSRFLSAKKLADVDMNVASIKKLMCGKYKPNDQFFDIFNSTNDIRYALTFDSVLYEQFNSTNKTLILKKLWRTDGNCPMFYMRLAQMKLFQAEALERNGASVADVLAPLNDLRRRSGNVLLKAEDFSDRDDLVRTIFYEIVREMGLENGAEWFAAVRMRLSSGKRLISELNPVYSDDKQLAWQIPDDEVSYNTLMEPNPVFIRE